MCVCVYVCVCVSVCVCVACTEYVHLRNVRAIKASERLCVRERERESVCVCVCARERDSMRVCVCSCVRAWVCVRARVACTEHIHLRNVQVLSACGR